MVDLGIEFNVTEPLATVNSPTNGKENSVRLYYAMTGIDNICHSEYPTSTDRAIPVVIEPPFLRVVVEPRSDCTHMELSLCRLAHENASTVEDMDQILADYREGSWHTSCCSSTLVLDREARDSGFAAWFASLVDCSWYRLVLRAGNVDVHTILLQTQTATSSVGFFSDELNMADGIEDHCIQVGP